VNDDDLNMLHVVSRMMTLIYSVPLGICLTSILCLLPWRWMAWNILVVVLPTEIGSLLVFVMSRAACQRRWRERMEAA